MHVHMYLCYGVVIFFVKIKMLKLVLNVKFYSAVFDTLTAVLTFLE